MSEITLRCLSGHGFRHNEDDDIPLVCDMMLYDTAGESFVCGQRIATVDEMDQLERDISAEVERLKKRHDISDIVSPDAETTTNEHGGKQSHVPVRFDLIDGKAMFAMAAVLHDGAEKYSPGNWRLIPTRDHLNHALMHIYAYLSGDRTDDHLSHALCRITFANAVELDPEAGPERDE